MADPKDVGKLLSELHDQKIVNLDTSIRSMLAPESLGILNPGVTVGAAVIAWDGYGLVIKGAAPDLSQVETMASTIARVMRGGPGPSG
jgi:hypothetical protein